MGHYHNRRRPPSLSAAVLLAVFLLTLTVTATADLGGRGNNKDATTRARERRSVLGGSLPINPWMTDIRSVLAEVKRYQDEKNGSGKTGVE